LVALYSIPPFHEGLVTKRLTWLASLALLAACSSQLATPPNQITGDWGGTNISIRDSAAANAIVVQFACYAAIFAAPTLDASGNFSADGVVFMTRNMAGVPVHITGTALARTMRLSASAAQGPLQQFALIRNGAEVRAQLVCDA
jgi:hypothetical protein